MTMYKSHGMPGEPAMSGGTVDVDIRTVGGSTVGDTIPVSGTVDISGLSGTLDVDIKTLGGSVVPYGKLPVNATCSTVHCDQIGTWDVDIGATGTLDVDIKTLGGSVVPAGPLPVDATFAGTMDVDIKTLGGSLVPAGPLPVDATFAGTMDVDIVSASTIDVDIKTLGGSVVPAGPLPVSGTVDISGLSGTLDVDIKTLGGSVVPAGPLPTDMSSYPTADTWSCQSTIVGTVSSQIVAANADRKSIAIMNHTPSGVLYIGADTCCSTASGWPLQYKQWWLDGGIGVYTGTICGIAESGTIDVRVIETD